MGKDELRIWSDFWNGSRDMPQWIKWFTRSWRAGEVDAIGYGVVLGVVMVFAAVAGLTSLF